MTRKAAIRATGVLAGAASALLIHTPLHAQALPIAAGASMSFSKSDAILGGTPSALASILAQQSGAPATARAPMQPATYASAPVVPAILRAPQPVSPGVLNGHPDLFGTVALKIGHTPLDQRWRNADNARLAGAPARYAESLADLEPLARLEAVNRYVNDRVRYTEDQQQYGRGDYWAPAGETLARGRGDCEDYAIAKLQMLRRAGVSDRDLYLVIVKDLVRRADHAVLVVRAAGHMFVLDDGTDRILDSESVSDYRPVFTFAAAGGEWTHGYRVPAAPINVASAETPPSGAESGDQRSRSASLLAFNTGFNR
jgi:predicted transglutaminase-like cysteine proteinase